MRHLKITFVISLLAGLAIFFIQCVSGSSSSGKDERGRQYAGAKVCSSCHKDITNSYAHTNHYKTSGEIKSNELSEFIDSNKVVYFSDSSQVSLEKKQSSFFQSHIAGGKIRQTEKLSIAIGSAEKAQTYGYWKNGQLFQLPLTYFAGMHSWTNSPGFPIAQPYFERVILSRCFECHASYVEKTDIQTGPLQISEKLIPNSFIYGIDCERCHGPAAEHVKFHRENPAVKESRHITSIKSLSRQQQLDMCAACHSGNDLDVQRSLFAFTPGNTLSNFYYPHFGSDGKEPDVHGKQMQLLQSSKCFQQSDMTCTSCHNTHRPERNQHEIYSAKCIACHQQGQHVLQMKENNKNCVNCHMPLQVSKALNFNDGSETKSIPYFLRTHKIAIYQDFK